MNIILLSGGGGKRLWPLSNEVRSKQFLPLLKNENGNYESMVQRVYRQIMSANPMAKITIATSDSQVGIIHDQLGSLVSVCVEPCRKDTFPAIALTSAYLKYVCNLDDSESVIVCPVDPFADDTFFETIARLDHLVAEDHFDITLIGIEPTYPSETYGYIVPATEEYIGRVKAFKEKPDVPTAQKYIAEGALWNAGVFAFKLGYIMEKAHSLIQFTDYNDFYQKYETLPQISFDYAVLEKESKVGVVRYAGNWRDIGTWDRATEVLPEVSRGNVFMDAACNHTYAINEIDIPLLCMGCKDMVVAVSSNGILVSDKNQSAGMKTYVDRISAHRQPNGISCRVIDAQPGAMTMKITLGKQCKLNCHSHRFRDEIWNILSGEGCVWIDGSEKKVIPGDIITLKAGCKHALAADTDMNVLEIQLGDAISKEDETVYPLKLD